MSIYRLSTFSPVLTTLVHFEKSLKMCFAMKYAQHCTPLNLELYKSRRLVIAEWVERFDSRPQQCVEVHKRPLIPNYPLT